MTEAPTLETKLETREIPRFDIPSTTVREDYLGQRTEVTRANSTRAAVSLHRLMNLLGPTLLKLLAWSDEHAPVEPKKGAKLEDAPQGIAKMLGFLDFTSDQTKTFVMAQALPALKAEFDKLTTADLLFHVDNLLVGHLKVGAVQITTRAELDATGISVTALLPLLWDAIEVNYFPTSADPDTGSGSAGSASDVVPSITNRKKRAQKRQSTRDAKGRAGRSALTRKS